MARYESEHTKFMREWLKQNPAQIEEARKGRALWWDKMPQDQDIQRSDREAKVERKAYYYDAN